MKLKKKTKLIIVFIVIIALCIGAFFAYKEVKRNIEYKKVFKELSNKVFYNNNPDFKDNLGKATGFAEYARLNPDVGRMQLIRVYCAKLRSLVCANE